MPRRAAKNKKKRVGVSCRFNEDFVARVDEALEREGYDCRSMFIFNALQRELERLDALAATRCADADRAATEPAATATPQDNRNDLADVLYLPTPRPTVAKRQQQ